MQADLTEVEHKLKQVETKVAGAQRVNTPV
jgi:hypothetical protein